LVIGDVGLAPIPNPQSPIPNPQSPYLAIKFIMKDFIKNNKFYYLKAFLNKWKQN